MKRLMCAMLLTVLFISSIPAFRCVAGSEAQAPQFRTVWENPYTLTTYHPDDEVNSTFYTFPKVIWNGSQYVDYILNSSDMSAGIGSVYIKVCPDHAIFYDPYRREERIKAEDWMVEHYNASSSMWETDTPLDYSVHSLINSSGIYFDRTTKLSSGATLDEWYWLRIGSELKISVILHPAQSGEYRLAWLLSDVFGTKARWLATTENVTAQLVDDRSCSRVRFASENESKCLVDWSDAGFFNETAKKWKTYFQELKMGRDVSNGRCQARVSFGDFSLNAAESVILDPTINTFNSTFNSDAVLDGIIERAGVSYPPNGTTIVDTSGTILGVGQYFVPGIQYITDRAYLSFDTSSVPALAYNMNVTLRLETAHDSSTRDFAVQVWGGNQPVCDGNLTILSGVQPIYGDGLTAGSWGTGKVKVATWNTVNYPGDGVYINLTIPSNQINKTGSTQFELNSSRDGTNDPQPNYDEAVNFYSGNSTGNEPKLEVSYCLDMVPINGETWFYRGVSTAKVVIVFFGAKYDTQNDTFEWIRSIDLLDSPQGPEKYLDKIMFLDALVANGFSVYTPSHDSDPSDDAYHSAYGSNSPWVQDLTMYLMYNRTYTQVYLFGFSGGAVVVGNEIQKDYASRFSAAVMNCAPVDWSALSGQIWHTALTASKAKVATFFPENVNDHLEQIPPFYQQEKEYYDNALVNKEWHNWTGNHGDFFAPNCTCMDPPYENDSVAVINWYNAAHPPSTPFTPSGREWGYTGISYGYTSGTVDPNGDNVSYQFAWGDGTNNTTGYLPSGTNVTVYHSWNAAGTYNVTVRAQDATNWSTWSQPWTVTLYGAGDANHDGTVNILDAIVLGNAFLSTPGSPNWNSAADLNNDGIVNILDAIVLGNNFGRSYATGMGMSGQQLSGGAMTGGGASVLVDPSQITVFKGEVFTANVKVTSVTDLQGWEFKLYWNSTILNCTNVVVQTPTEWQNNTQNYGSGLQANYNATHGRFWKAQSAQYPASSFNGSMTLATLTFQAMQPGTTSLTLTDTTLGNSTAQPIACSVSSGSVNVYYGRYMRSDTQTVNGLGAYKLNIPQSTSYTYTTQSGSGAGASWGIRAWVRHSNGAEQEISLDGQTGTPTAVVSRARGSGMQSGTVSVAQTGLQQTDSLVIRVYVQVGDSDWTLCATFTTEQLQATTLKAVTWTVYYYTYTSWNRLTDWTTSMLYWGTTTYNSRIQNLQYA